MNQAVLGRSRQLPTRLGGFQYVGTVVAIAALYAATGRLGLLLAQTQENATLIWPPTGLALAAMVLFGRRVWPGVLLGAILTNATIGTAPGPLVGIAIGNTLEALVAWFLLTRVARLNTDFARLRDVVAFLAFGVLASTMVSATIGVGSLYLGGEVEPRAFGTVWLIWWLGDAGGAAVVAPLILVGLSGRPSWGAMVRRAEAWAALLALATLVAFGFAGVMRVPWQGLLLALLVFPVVVWVGLRLGPRGAVLAAFVAGAGAVLGTARGTGPFVAVGSASSLYLVWAYAFALATVAMIVAAAVAETEDSERARRAGEDERRQMATQMQHVQRLESLGLLAGGVAHDFNNLLVAIRVNAELLRTSPELAMDQGEAMLGEIEVASDRAGELCRQLLIYAGRSRPEKAPVDLESIVDEMAPLLAASMAGAELELSTGGVPAVLGDRTQLGQVIMNLVLNAAHATSERGGTVTVSLETREVTGAHLRDTFLRSEAPAGRYLVLEVSDDGVGMTPEILERIFDPFFTMRSEGRGLGMPSVLGIVRAHEGAIKVDSAPGVGTTFEVFLPILVGVEAIEAPAETKAPEPVRDAGTVLLAEDNDQVREVTRMVLEDAGFEVLQAHDGAEAVELFEECGERIDALLFDVSMPRMSGTDALARIHGLAPEIPAVLMSGYDAGRTNRVPETPFVQKPFKSARLLEALRGAMEAKREAMEAKRGAMEAKREAMAKRGAAAAR